MFFHYDRPFAYRSGPSAVEPVPFSAANYANVGSKITIYGYNFGYSGYSPYTYYNGLRKKAFQQQDRVRQWRAKARQMTRNHYRDLTNHIPASGLDAAKSGFR